MYAIWGVRNTPPLVFILQHHSLGKMHSKCGKSSERQSADNRLYIDVKSILFCASLVIMFNLQDGGVHQPSDLIRTIRKVLNAQKEFTSSTFGQLLLHEGS